MKEEKKNYWICLNDSRNCVNAGGLNLLGEADCELCGAFNSCASCGRSGTTFCKKCEVSGNVQSGTG